MVKALNKYIPKLIHTVSSSGFLIWGKFSSSIDARRLFWHALKNEKVSFLPGSVFGSSDDNFNHCLRLSFSYCPYNSIEIGVERLEHLKLIPLKSQVQAIATTTFLSPL